jgi:hypothetical protein
LPGLWGEPEPEREEPRSAEEPDPELLLDDELLDADAVDEEEEEEEE